jgi:hypothetical protein
VMMYLGTHYVYAEFRPDRIPNMAARGHYSFINNNNNNNNNNIYFSPNKPFSGIRGYMTYSLHMVDRAKEFFTQIIHFR